MDAGDADALAHALNVDIDKPVLGERLVIHRDLIALGKVGIKIILAGETGKWPDGAIQRHAGLHREFYRFPVEDRQSAGQAEAYRADIGVRRSAEAGGTSTKYLGARTELNVDFQPDYRLVLRDEVSGGQVNFQCRHFLYRIATGPRHGKLTPVSFHHDPAAIPTHPMVRYPMRMRTGRHHPGARDPDIGSAVPTVIPGSPHITWAGSRNAPLYQRPRWRDLHGYLGIGRSNGQKNTKRCS